VSVTITSGQPREEQLPAALARNLDASFEQLVLTYQDRLYAFAGHLSGSPQDAEEIVQDAFVRAYRALAEYAPERVESLALRPWLYQITLNVYRNRRRVRQPQLVPLADDADDGVELADDVMQRPEALLERAEQARALSRLVAELPERYRAAVILRHIAGFGYNDLADLLHQPVGTIKANVHRGAKLLRAAVVAQLEEAIE
jgi:RNA polymerase sigma-70 factor (ECF subfamily)